MECNVSDVLRQTCPGGDGPKSFLCLSTMKLNVVSRFLFLDRLEFTVAESMSLSLYRFADVSRHSGDDLDCWHVEAELGICSCNLRTPRSSSAMSGMHHYNRPRVGRHGMSLFGKMIQATTAQVRNDWMVTLWASRRLHHQRCDRCLMRPLVNAYR